MDKPHGPVQKSRRELSSILHRWKRALFRSQEQLDALQFAVAREAESLLYIAPADEVSHVVVHGRDPLIGFEDTSSLQAFKTTSVE